MALSNQSFLKNLLPSDAWDTFITEVAAIATGAVPAGSISATELATTLDLAGKTITLDTTTVGTDKKVQFRDAGLYLNSSADGTLDIVADTILAITAPSMTLSGDTTVATTEKVQFRDAAIFIQSSADGQLDLEADGELEITSPIVDIDASTGLALDGANLNSAWTVNTDKKIQFRDTGLFIQSSADGQLDIEADALLKLTGATEVAGAATVTSAGASALAVGVNGATNPVLKIDASTASAATGVEVAGAAAAGGVALTTLSSGTDESLTIDAKGSGTVTINGTATGIVVLPSGTTIGGSAVVALATITSSSANALTTGPNGAINPSFNVDASTVSAATGLNVTAAAAAGGLAIDVISSGAAENLTIDAKGTGTIGIGSVSTGAVAITPATEITGLATLTGGATIGGALIQGGTGAITSTSGAGAVAVTGQIHEVTTTGTGDALTLVNGTAGQRLSVIYVAETAGGDTAVLTPTTLAGGATITFNNLGDSADLAYSSTGGWYVLGLGGAAAVA